MGTTLIQERQSGSRLSKLSDQQRVFVAELLADDLFSPTEAARRAGYKNPPQAANKLLKNPTVAAALGKSLRQRLERCELKSDALLRELAASVNRDPLDLCDEDGTLITDDLRKLPEHIRRCIDSIKCRQQFDKDGNVVGQTIELKLTPKLQAIELAMKHFGLLKPIEHSIKMSVDWDRLYEDRSSEPVADPIAERIASVTQAPLNAVEQVPLAPVRYSVADLVAQAE